MFERVGPTFHLRDSLKKCQSIRLDSVRSRSDFGPMEKAKNWFYLTVKLEAFYSVALAAESEEEAITAANGTSIPVNRLGYVEKSVVNALKIPQASELASERSEVEDQRPN